MLEYSGLEVDIRERGQGNVLSADAVDVNYWRVCIMNFRLKLTELYSKCCILSPSPTQMH